MTDQSTTQPGAIWFPNKRAIRTVIQVVVAWVITLAGVIATLALVAPEVLAAIAALLTPEAYAVVASWVAALAAIAGALARIMAIPAVDRFLKAFGAGSTPASVEVPPAVETEKDLAVVSALTSDIPSQIAALEAAAQRLGIRRELLTRDDYRDATGLE